MDDFIVKNKIKFSHAIDVFSSYPSIPTDDNQDEDKLSSTIQLLCYVIPYLRRRAITPSSKWFSIFLSFLGKYLGEIHTHTHLLGTLKSYFHFVYRMHDRKTRWSVSFVVFCNRTSNIDSKFIPNYLSHSTTISIHLHSAFSVCPRINRMFGLLEIDAIIERIGGVESAQCMSMANRKGAMDQTATVLILKARHPLSSPSATNRANAIAISITFKSLVCSQSFECNHFLEIYLCRFTVSLIWEPFPRIRVKSFSFLFSSFGIFLLSVYIRLNILFILHSSQQFIVPFSIGFTVPQLTTTRC